MFLDSTFIALSTFVIKAIILYIIQCTFNAQSRSLGKSTSSSFSSSIKLSSFTNKDYCDAMNCSDRGKIFQDKHCNFEIRRKQLEVSKVAVSVLPRSKK